MNDLESIFHVKIRFRPALFESSFEFQKQYNHCDANSVFCALHDLSTSIGCIHGSIDRRRNQWEQSSRRSSRRRSPRQSSRRSLRVYITGDRRRDNRLLVAGLDRWLSPQRSPVMYTRGDRCGHCRGDRRHHDRSDSRRDDRLVSTPYK